MIAPPLLVPPIPPRRRGILPALERVAQALTDAIGQRQGMKAVVCLIALLLLVALLLLLGALKIALWFLFGFLRLLGAVALKAHANQQARKPKPAKKRKPKVKVKVKHTGHRRHSHGSHMHPFVLLELARIFERGRLPRHPRQKPN